jgi:hypothetical protein
MLDFKSLKHRIKPYAPYGLIKLRKKLKENQPRPYNLGFMLRDCA